MLGKVKAIFDHVEQDEDTLITFRVPPSQRYLCNEMLSEIEKVIEDGKPDLFLWVDKYFYKRSIDQNNLMWVLLTELSTALHKDKWDLYKDMLRSYGVWEYIIVLDKAIPYLERVYRIVDQVDEKIENDKKMVKTMCYLGSSQYNTKQMTTLLDGVIADCVDQGIDTDIVRRKILI